MLGSHSSPPAAARRSESFVRPRNTFDTILFHASNTTEMGHRKRNDVGRRHKLSSCYSNMAMFAFQFLFLASPSSASSELESPSPFRIVIDAGSTGSRLHIFEMVTTTVSANNFDNSSSSGNSDFTRKECLRRGSSKAWMPLSAFASSDEDGTSNPNATTAHVANHMLPLFEYASIVIPSESHSSTPVRIAATAGMRLFSAEEQDRVYDALYYGLLDEVATGQFTFINLRREDIMTLNGEKEGYYGAVAANYLRGVVDAELKMIVPPDNDETKPEDTNDQGLCTNKFGMCEQDAEDIVFGPSQHYVPQNMHDVRRHGPLGALDMGGSSTQIVYRNTASDESIERDDALDYVVPSHLHDEEFFSTSYLSYGADQFRERLWDLWVSEAEKSSPGRDDLEQSRPVLFNPCSFMGYQMSYKGYNLLGTGNAILCAEQINRLIPYDDNAIDLDELYDENIESSRSKEERQPQTLKKKMVGGVEHPPLRGKFFGMSLYFFTLDCLRELSDPDHPIHVSWPTPSIEELTHALDGFCARKWQGDLEEVRHEVHEHTRAEVLPHRCFEAVYMVTLLRDGFGFQLSSRDITFTQWVSGNEVEWSLGMALSEFAAEKGTE